MVNPLLYLSFHVFKNLLMSADPDETPTSALDLHWRSGLSVCIHNRVNRYGLYLVSEN